MLSTMYVDSPRPPVFTFQSTVHSEHVLRCLDEQRQRDVLCDVTVLVENKSFRAHRSVLASCSDYFGARVSSHGVPGQVVTLPDEVTVDGFEPLLQFAYTTKLLFTKENILEIRNCAELLGFKNLDQSCFDFLIPKFFDANKSAGSVPRKRCCKKNKCCKLPKPEKSAADDEDVGGDGGNNASSSSQPKQEPPGPATKVTADPSESCGPGSMGAEPQVDYSQLCKYRKFQTACREACGSEVLPPTLAASDERCRLKCPPCSSAVDCEDLVAPTCSKGLSPKERGGVPASTCLERAQFKQGSNPGDSADLTGLSEAADLEEASKRAPTDTQLPGPSGKGCQPGTKAMPSGRERSSVEREVAEHLAKGLWANCCPSQPYPPLPNKAPDLHWQLDVGSGTQECPFLRDLGAVGAKLPDSEGSSRPEGSPCVSSVNSGEDSDSFDTEGDSESYTSERASELPFSVEQIASLSRNDFQQVLKLRCLTREQLDLVHDLRRRSKNRIAARRCRKRKLDCIHNLQCEIEKLRSEKEKLAMEHTQLSQLRQKTWQSLSGLYQKVCLYQKAALSPEQLQVLAKYTPAACPLSSLVCPVISPGVEEPQQAPDPKTARDTFSTEPSTSSAVKPMLEENQGAPQAQAIPASDCVGGLSGTSTTEDLGCGAFPKIRPDPVCRLITEK
ncbi:transcription regulator protein BACH1b [Denticeps clupeoides]|uniref:Transcription regulator protein BACH1 n=1 Tax=Denticeps clupeoides TaxID=299321 RepID=A0AAY4CPP8_9TELE|nr:transcription regulator protein BACH2-like [Denticeps clupeoides]XP_028839677.1 transcription regulator protein BACH2-like [Denticeps clupeoides]XP_028839678.1 transcription regulator protein BACH2-like [Denticeps clupeoides]XP_028839679.1 transcription regulator protein BACH2-like [Denticeps clupeoides]XP_028839680.1 transcription regulator protein BACH2-like [Denticeps clupeoides]